MMMYIGYDGSYVLSRKPLLAAIEPDGFTYLSSKNHRPVIVDIGKEGGVVLSRLKLKRMEVAEVSIRVVRRSVKRAKGVR